MFVIVFSLLASISTKLKNTIPSKLLNLFSITLSVNSGNQEPKLSREYATTDYTNKYTLSAVSPPKSNHLTNVLRGLAALQNSLIQLKSPKKPNLFSTAPRTTFVNITFINNRIKNLPTQWSLTSSESNYGKIPTPNKMINTSLNLKNVQTYNNLHKSLTYFDFNLLTNINSGKEQRWLVKNSILTEFLTKNTNSFTQSKKLLGLSNYNNSFSNKNIWLASKLSNLNNTEALSYINNLNSSLYPTTINSLDYNFSINSSPLKTSNLLNLNFFENSRIWTTKKFFFNNQMLNNLPSHAKYHTDQNSKTAYGLNISKFTPNIDTHKLLITNSTSDLSSLMWPSVAKFGYSNNVLDGTMAGRSNLTLNISNIDLLSNSDLSFIVNVTSNIKPSSTDLNYYTPNPSIHSLNVSTVSFKLN